MNDTSYTRRDEESIYEYLKSKAAELSEGRWTDFSSGDIGSVLLGLMAYLADANNFHIDKTASELFLDTAVERSSIMSILKLIGYQPRHYMSATANISIKATGDASKDITDTKIIPAYSTFTNTAGTITYTTLTDIQIDNGEGFGTVYEGTQVLTTYTFSQISSDGKLYLPDYKIGMNTIQLSIPSVSSKLIQRVTDVRYIDGTFAFSAHVDEFSRVYIQLPSYWADILTETTVLTVSYLLTSGEAGRIGANILVKPGKGLSLGTAYSITNDLPSDGGYFPETADDIKVSAPRYARTMETIVTKRDLEDVVRNLGYIADIKAGDYNDKWTGYIQPDDAYKCKVLAVPLNPLELSLYNEDGQPTQTLKDLMEYIDDRRLCSLMMTYEDPKRIVPDIKLEIYTDVDDLRAATIANNAQYFMKTIYSRDYLRIGKALHGSVIGKDLLNAYPEITYLEVQSPEYKIDCPDDSYIDMYYARFKIYVNDVLKVNEWDDGEEVK